MKQDQFAKFSLSLIGNAHSNTAEFWLLGKLSHSLPHLNLRTPINFLLKVSSNAVSWTQDASKVP